MSLNSFLRIRNTAQVPRKQYNGQCLREGKVGPNPIVSNESIPVSVQIPMYARKLHFDSSTDFFLNFRF